MAGGGPGGSFGELGRFEIPIDIALEKLISDLAKAVRAYNHTVNIMLRTTTILTNAGTEAQRGFANAARMNSREIQKLNNTAIGGQKALTQVLNQNKQVMAQITQGGGRQRVVGGGGGSAAVTGASAALGAQSRVTGILTGQMKTLVGQLGLAYVSYKALRAVTIDAAAAQIRFESSFAGVRKTVKASEQEFAALSRQIRNVALETPVDVNELNAIASAAGQLGIAKENIIDFTETIAMIGVTTDLTTERAALALAQWAEITQLPETQIRNLASAIVDLGNNSATMESNIVEMGLRIAGSGKLIGLTDAQIAGLAATMASLGIEAEAGGTAVSRIMSTVAQSVRTASPQLELFATLAGMTSDAFSQLFDRDAGEAIIRIVEGMGKLEDAGGNLFTVLEELELGDLRVRDALLRAAGAGDLMRESMERGTDAFRDNTALAKEAEERYKTTESQIQLLKNAFGDLQIAIGDALGPTTQGIIGSATGTVNTLRSAVENAGDAWTALIHPISVVIGLLNKIPNVENMQLPSAFTQEFTRPVPGAADAFAQRNAYQALVDENFVRSALSGDTSQEPVSSAEVVTDEIKKATDEAAKFAESVSSALGKIQDGAGAAGDAAKKSADEQARAARIMSDEMESAMREIEARFSAVRSLIERARPVEGLIGDLQEISGLFDQVPEAFGENLDLILKSAIQQYADAGGDITDGIIAQVVERIPAMEEQIKAAMESISVNLAEQGSLSLLPEIDEEILQDLEEKFAPLLQKYGEVLDLVGAISAEMQHFGREGESAFEETVGGAGQAIGAILSVVAGYAAIQTAATAAAGTAAAAWLTILGPIYLVIAAVNAAVTVFGLFGDKAEDELSDTEQVIEDVKKAFDDFLSDLTDAIVEFVKDGEFNFNQLLEGLLEDLLRIGIDATITDPIRGALGISGSKSAAASVTSTKGIGTDGAALFDDMPAFESRVEVNIIDQRSAGDGGVDVKETTRSDGTRVIDAVIYDSVRRQMDSGGFDGVLGRNFQGFTRRGKRRAR